MTLPGVRVSPWRIAQPLMLHHKHWKQKRSMVQRKESWGRRKPHQSTNPHQSTKNILEDSTVSKSKSQKCWPVKVFASGQPPVRVMFWYLDSTKTTLQIPLICEGLGWVGTQLDLKGVRFRLCEICAKQRALQSLFCLGVKCVFFDRFRLVLTPITAN